MTDLILKNGTTYTPEDSDLISWQRTYKNVDIYSEIDAACAWCDANPSRRKINGKRFLVNWLKRANDRGGSGMVRPGVKSTRHMSMDEMLNDRSWAQ